LDLAWEEAQRFVNTTGHVSGPAVDEVTDLVSRKRSQGPPSRDHHKIVELERLLCGS
jgi:hypothetical protein